MKTSIRLMLLVACLVTITVQGMQKTVKSGKKALAKAKFFHKTTKQLKKGNSTFLKDTSVARRFGNLMRSKSIEEFAEEPHEYSIAKKNLIEEAADKGISIPIDAAEKTRLAYGTELPTIKELLIKEYKPFFPLIDRALAEEKAALQKGKPVLYHGINKQIYKYMYFLTKILELNDLSYPGYLLLRGSASHYKPNENSSLIRERYLEKGCKRDNSPEARYHLMSTSNSLFTEMPGFLEGPLQFLASNYNTSAAFSDLQRICEQYQVDDYYHDVMDMFKAMHIKGGGILLQCIFDKELFSKTAYAAKAFGVKRDDSDEIIANIINLENLSDETLIKLQFRLILTDDLLLNPKNPETRKGFKVNVYAQDQAALEEFHEKVDAFFATLKNEIERNRRRRFEGPKELPKEELPLAPSPF